MSLTYGPGNLVGLRLPLGKLNLQNHGVRKCPRNPLRTASGTVLETARFTSVMGKLVARCLKNCWRPHGGLDCPALSLSLSFYLSLSPPIFLFLSLSRSLSPSAERIEAGNVPHRARMALKEREHALHCFPRAGLVITFLEQG